jgi:hypothetical protein
MILAACEGCRTVKLDPEPLSPTEEGKKELLRMNVVPSPHRIVVWCDTCNRWSNFILFDPTVKQEHTS